MAIDVTVLTSFSCSSLPSILESVASDLDIKFGCGDLFNNFHLSDRSTASAITIVLVRLEDLVYDHPEQRAFGNLPDAEERKRTMKNEGYDNTELSAFLLEIPPAVEVWRKGAERLTEFLLKKSIPSNALVLVCPSCPAAYEEDIEGSRTRCEALLQIVKDCPQIIVTDVQLRFLYQHSYYDASRDLNEHTPFVLAFESMIAYISLRFVHANVLANSPKKVIVLDCDNTLWGGVVGEDGSQHVKLTPPFTSLQSFFLQQKQRGLLLVLSSKNSEDDVASVFSTRSMEMVLSRNDIADSEIGWERKSLGIARMAERLSLDVSSFIFVDDSELECAEVKNALPAVTVLCLPPSPDDFEKFLQSHWVFDTPTTCFQNVFINKGHSSVFSSSSAPFSSPLTEEDLRRTQLYKEQADRQAARPAFSSFSSFLSDLGVKITISKLTREGIPRAVQLSVRTNQMNAAKRPFLAEEFENIVANGVKEEQEGTTSPTYSTTKSVWTVHAADRFGAYGVVGLLVTSSSSSSSSLQVESFLLSCRVLQRGVEHCMLRHLGNVASQRGLTHVCIRWIPSDRNEPMRAFLFSGALEDYYVPDHNSDNVEVKMKEKEEEESRFMNEFIESKNYLSSLSNTLQQAQSNLPPFNTSSRRDCRFGRRCERFGLDDEHSQLFNHSFFKESEFCLSDFIDRLNIQTASFEGDKKAAVIIRARMEREKRRIDRAFLGGRPSHVTVKPKEGNVMIPTAVAIALSFNADDIDEESEQAANLLRNAGESSNNSGGGGGGGGGRRTIDQSAAFLGMACTTTALLRTPNFGFLLERYKSVASSSFSSSISASQENADDDERAQTHNRMELRRKSRAKLINQ